MSAVDVVTEQETEVVAVVNETVARARALEVQTSGQAQDAVEFLAQIADAKKRSEKARKFLVDPMNKHIKAINARFKSNAEPLDEADALVRRKLIAFQQAEARELAEQQARADAERLAAERAAEEKRRADAAAAAKAEGEAREAEERRQAKLREAADERARELAKLDDAELATLIASSEDEADLALARAEFQSREAARDAQERAEEARRRVEEATQAQIATASAPAVEVAPTELASASGSASTRMVWKATVTDEAAVPRKYLIVDQKAVNAAVKAGEREIPGVRIEQVPELAVRAGR
jgi:hypothetical protein